MKYVLNLILILVTILNPLVSFQSSASAPLQPQAQVAATPTVQPGLNGAYPAPATPTPLPTATRVAPTPTLQPTAAPTATPTVTPTPKPAKQPKPEVNLPPGLARKVAKGGGEISGLDGRVKMIFPADTLAEDADVWIIPIAEADLPPTNLSGKPFQIVAKGQNSQQSIRKFAKNVTIELSYDPKTLRGNESDLVMYYYDENREEWVPLSSWVDRKQHILYASTDHLTVFDFQAVSWEAARRPDVKAGQTALFTGAGTYRYPLTLPEGPGGLKPNLTLNYNSQVVDGATLTTQASWVGMGWSLETGYIRRTIDDSDYGNYTLPGDDHLPE